MIAYISNLPTGTPDKDTVIHYTKNEKVTACGINIEESLKMYDENWYTWYEEPNSINCPLCIERRNVE
jgi:hypothetical protein